MHGICYFSVLALGVKVSRPYYECVMPPYILYKNFVYFSAKDGNSDCCLPSCTAHLANRKLQIAALSWWHYLTVVFTTSAVH
jgi:hypothetical protein